MRTPSIKSYNPRFPRTTILPKYKTIVLFDRNVIRRNWKAINFTPLQRASAYVRIDARQSIKRRKGRKRKDGTVNRKPSPAFSAPRSWQSGSPPPFKMIYNLPWGQWKFANDLATSWVVGMVGFGGPGPAVPGLHEHGGTARRTVWRDEKRKRKSTRREVKTRRPYKITVRYPPRPFMLPALFRQRKKMPQLWKNSLKRASTASFLNAA